MVSVGNSIQHNKIVMSSSDMNSFEGLDRTLSNLSMLDETLGYVSQRFDTQQNQYKDRIQLFLDRINLCQKKIAALQGVKKAIVFTSPSQFVTKYKYTVDDKASLLKDYKQKHNINRFEAQFGYQLKNDPEQVGQIIDNTRPDDLYQVLQISYGKFKTREKNPFENRKLPLKERNQNIGPYPKRIKCAESLLVMNTNINPYRKYQQVDNLILDENKYQPRAKVTDGNQINLQEAPKGISETLHEYKRTEYTFNPKPKEVQNNVPIPLNMDFDDIAEDIDYDYGGQELYQPSEQWLKTKPVIPDPYANRSAATTASSAPPSNQPQNNSQPPQQNYQQQPQQQSNQSVPQAPPMNSNIPSAPPMNNNIPSAPAMNIPQAPQMNIPQPPSMNIQQAAPQIQAPPQQNNDEPAGGRGALLDEIRNPKVKLRKTVTVIKGGLNTGKKKEDEVSGDIKKTSSGLDPLQELKKNVEARFRSLHPPSKKAQKSKNIVGNDDEVSERSSEED